MSKATARTWLRKQRVDRDVSQEQLAVELKVSRTTVARWETGTHSPTFEQAGKIAQWANCSLDEVAQAFGVATAA